MEAIRVKGQVTPQGILTAHVPSDISPGEHQLILIFEETTYLPQEDWLSELKTFSWLGWVPESTFRREDLYDKNGQGGFYANTTGKAC